MAETVIDYCPECNKKTLYQFHDNEWHCAFCLRVFRMSKLPHGTVRYKFLHFRKDIDDR